MHFIQFILAFLILLHLPSCTHKELCTDHSHVMEVDVRFDWSAVPDAAPETMSLYLFPLDGGKSQRYEFTDFRGGRIRVKAGEYQAICLNSDTRNLRLEDIDRYEMFRITTKDSDMILQAKGIDDERVAVGPEPVWTDNMDHILLDETGEAVRMAPDRAYIDVSIEIVNVENIEYACYVIGALTSMSEGYHPGADELSEQNVTIPFELSASDDKPVISGSLRTFGECPVWKNRHFVTIYATMTDNTNVAYTYDVTDQVHNMGESGEIVIKIDELPLPEPERKEDGGFQPDVGEWSTIEIGINM